MSPDTRQRRGPGSSGGRSRAVSPAPRPRPGAAAPLPSPSAASPAVCAGGPARSLVTLPSLGRRPDRTGLLVFPPTGRRNPARRARLAPRHDGAAGSTSGCPTGGISGLVSQTVRCTGTGPPLGTVKTPARCGGFAPGRPPRASGYPTLLSPPEGGRGVQCLPPRRWLGGTERPEVLSFSFETFFCPGNCWPNPRICR